jgi:hypothetical protein
MYFFAYHDISLFKVKSNSKPSPFTQQVNAPLTIRGQQPHNVIPLHQLLTILKAC